MIPNALNKQSCYEPGIDRLSNSIDSTIFARCMSDFFEYIPYINIIVFPKDLGLYPSECFLSILSFERNHSLTLPFCYFLFL